MTGNFYKVKRWPGDGKIICSKCKKYIINSSRKRYKDAQLYMGELEYNHLRRKVHLGLKKISKNIMDYHRTVLGMGCIIVV